MDLVAQFGTLIPKDKVEALQIELLKMPQADIKTIHTFLPNVYERTIRIPAWTVLTGAAHKTAYKIRLDKGTIAVNTDDGVKVLTAPYEFDAPAGVQRVGRVFEDEVVWTDIYDNPDNCTDIAILEDRLYEIPDCGLGENRVAGKIKADQDDYALFISQLGIPQDKIDDIVNTTSDLVAMPPEYAVELRESKLHGKGLFALKEFNKGDIVCAGRLNGNRTPGGRYINHSFDSNIMPEKVDDDNFAIAKRTIYTNEELLVDYRASMRVNFGLMIEGELPCQDGQQQQ